MKLNFAGLDLNPYQSNVALAFIYFDQNNSPRDHRNQPIGTFYQEPFELEKEVNNKILPVICNGLSNTPYKTRGTDFVNNAPHPAIEIMRKDNGPVSQIDMANISNILNSMVNQNNQTHAPTFFQPHAHHHAKDSHHKKHEDRHHHIDSRRHR
ncbi:MAG: hypothetical protein H0W64_12550 [Gammaproteobacteria bacterium]|nr:hypothetical protein [Gammaproteobacteria bacterium]